MLLVILNESENPDPKKAHDTDAGFDIASNVTVKLAPGVIAYIPTGLFMIIEDGFEGVIRPRSGASSTFLTLANSPGTIDSGYRGEIMIKVFNRTNEIYQIFLGDKIAQMTFQEVIKVEVVKFSREDFDICTTERGTGGFGSTGK